MMLSKRQGHLGHVLFSNSKCLNQLVHQCRMIRFFSVLQHILQYPGQWRSNCNIAQSYMNFVIRAVSHKCFSNFNRKKECIWNIWCIIEQWQFWWVQVWFSQTSKNTYGFDPLTYSFQLCFPWNHTIITLSIQIDRHSDRPDPACRPRSDPTECGVWSGCILFATHPAMFKTYHQIVDCQLVEIM